MPRKRNKNNRIDYRSGGRAQFQPGGTVEIPAFKTQAQFFKEYDEINPPHPVNKMTVKRRQEHSANRTQAYTDYTTDYVANQQQATQEAINSAVGIAIKNYDAQMKADAATRARSQNTNNTTNTGKFFVGNETYSSTSAVFAGYIAEFYIINNSQLKDTYNFEITTINLPDHYNSIGNNN